MSGWSNKQTVLEFIEIYRSLPALWKVKSKEYSNKFAKDKGYNQLIEFCKTFEKEADKTYVVPKINNLRSSFRKEMKKVDKSKLSGAGTDLVYETKLWYYKDIQFIQDQEIVRSGASNLDVVMPTCSRNLLQAPLDESQSSSQEVEREVC